MKNHVHFENVKQNERTHTRARGARARVATPRDVVPIVRYLQRARTHAGDDADDATRSRARTARAREVEAAYAAAAGVAGAGTIM